MRNNNGNRKTLPSPFAAAGNRVAGTYTVDATDLNVEAALGNVERIIRRALGHVTFIFY